MWRVRKYSRTFIIAENYTYFDSFYSIFLPLKRRKNNSFVAMKYIYFYSKNSFSSKYIFLFFAKTILFFSIQNLLNLYNILPYD